jgi:hypothetical protein
MLILIGLMAVFLLVLGSFLAYYGISAGILEQRIIGPLNQGTLVGRAAVVRGLGYLAVGLLMDFGAVFIAVDLWSRR